MHSEKQSPGPQPVKPYWKMPLQCQAGPYAHCTLPHARALGPCVFLTPLQSVLHDPHPDNYAVGDLRKHRAEVAALRPFHMGPGVASGHAAGQRVLALYMCFGGGLGVWPLSYVR